MDPVLVDLARALVGAVELAQLGHPWSQPSTDGKISEFLQLHR